MVLATNEPVIICDDIIPAAVSAPLRSYANAISGGFSYNGKPCSITMAWGNIIQPNACHAHAGKPETVIYQLPSGLVCITRVKSAAELPNGTKWAVGGMGLLGMYDPAAEGFTGQYADVLRRTAHTFLGTTASGRFVLGYVKSMSAAEINSYVNHMGLIKAIMLDGGHVAGINSSTAKINTNQTQYSIIQGV